MNARKTISLLVIGIIANFLCTKANTPLTTYCNIEDTPNGSMKEYTSFKKDTNEPTKKTVYLYDINGNIQERISYSWKGKKDGWRESEKLTYIYNEKNNKPSSLILSKWNNKTKSWSQTTQCMNYSEINN